MGRHAVHLAMSTTTPTRARDLRTTNEARCRTILSRSELLQVDDLDWDAVGSVELSAADIETLVYMRDVEGFTSSYLAGVGAHPTTLADPLVASFLEVWEAEEAVHAEAIGRYLQRYTTTRGLPLQPQAVAPTRHVPRRERALTALGGPVGRLVATAHMTWGAANELLTMNGYRLLAAGSGDPVLSELLRRIAAQEARHYSFYLLQAEWRLASSRLARKVLPRILRGSWTPVGIGDGYKTAEEFRRVIDHLNDSPDSQRIIARMDRRFAALPDWHGSRSTAGRPPSPVGRRLQADRAGDLARGQLPRAGTTVGSGAPPDGSSARSRRVTITMAGTTSAKATSPSSQ